MSRTNRIRAAIAAVTLQSAALLGVAMLTSVANAGGSNTACAVAVIPDTSCIGDACRGLWIGATEVDGVRHVVWKQFESEQRVMTASIDRDGVVRMGELPIDNSEAGPLPIKAIAVHGDLLAVGVAERLELFRLMDDDWTLEQSIPAAMPTGPRRLAIGIGSDGHERVVASSRDIIHHGESGGGSPVRVYRRDSEWTLEQAFPIPAGNVFNFGADIAIDGSTIVVGAPQPFVSAFTATGVQVYEMIDGVWTPTATLSSDVVEVILPNFDQANALGARVTLAGDTIVATLMRPQQFEWTLLSGIQQVFLQVFHRGEDGWIATQMIGCPSTRFGLGYELDSFLDGEDVIVTASMHRIYDRVIEGAVAFRIRNGFVVDETPLPVPSMMPDDVDSSTFGVAAVGGASPWVAVTAANDPSGVVHIIGLDAAACDTSNAADLNGDDVVDGADLGILLGQWGPCPGCPADLDGDGVVDGSDLGILLASWTTKP